jgi:hypothetical protein
MIIMPELFAREIISTCMVVLEHDSY